MDGDGRWAKARGLSRTEGHARGEDALCDVISGAIQIGVTYLSAYAFSTENWRRSPGEVRWLMGFNRDVIHRRAIELYADRDRHYGSAVPDEVQAVAASVLTPSWRRTRRPAARRGLAGPVRRSATGEAVPVTTCGCERVAAGRGTSRC